ncbi:MAG TPA: Gmad2 immunoglobulin-like domain-containing protein, partial [Acidimicrobiia bacterium]
ATTTTSSATPTSTLPPVIECPGAGEFGEGSGIAQVDGEGSDATDLGRVSWERSEQCESFIFEFETSEGAPATSVPDISIEHLPSLQVIRITMGIDAAVITDQLVETEMVDRLYVVRSLDGRMFVDLHLNAPAAARARVQSSPAVLTVDLRPGFLEFTGSSSIDDRTVVVSPSQRAEVDDIATFSGYSRAFEANVIVIVTQGDAVVTEANTTAADHLETWGEFNVDVPLPAGEVSVFVGEASAEDGSLDGVTLELTVN